MVRQILVTAVWLALVLQAVGTAEDPRADERPAASGQREANNRANDNAVIDFQRARELLQKARRGEKLTPDEQDYVDRAREARRRQSAQNRPQQRRPNQPAAQEEKASLGLTPLSDMSADDRYKDQDGGLYGGGRNAPPEAHLAAALAAAKQIQPLDAAGNPSRDGKVVLVSVGMSNTTQEFSRFVQLAAQDRSKSSQLVIVDGAQGGQDAAAWANPQEQTRADRPGVWEAVDQRLRRAGVTGRQVQAVWIKQARRNPAGIGEFPKHADALKEDLAAILGLLKERFPNLKLAYVSSRIYAGYARGALNPEPYAYESAFAVRSLIEDQIRGREELNYDAARGEVHAPVVLWGPYLWADGEKGRKPDKLVWLREDLAGDGTHPSDSGRRKVAELLLEFFKTDPTAKMWFTARE